MVAVDSAVAGRKRVVRGAAPARWVVALAAALLVTALLAVPAVPAPVQVALVPLALAAGWTAARQVRPLRTGSRRAASLALLGAGLLALCTLVVVDAAADVLREPGTDGPLGFAAGFTAGFGQGLPTVVYDPWTGTVNTAVVFPAALLLAGVVGGSSWGLRRRRRLPRVVSRVLRWTLLLVLSATAVALLASAVGLLADASVPAEAFAGLVLAPVLALSAGAAVEVLRGRRPLDGLPPPWEPVAGRPRRTWTGRRLPLVLLLQTGAVGALVAVVLLSQIPRFAVQPLVEGSGATTPGTVRTVSFAVWSVSVVLLLAGLQLHTLARRAAALDAAALRDDDHRPQVLYLRSFGDDDLVVRTHRSPRHSLFERLLSRRRERFEAMLTWHLWSFGPVVCVGRPRERLPRLGAAREYLSDEQWQEQVEQRIGAARAVVVVLGRTRGLLWELQALRRLGAETRTVLVVPPVDADELAHRWQVFDEVMAEAGWPRLPAAQRPGALAAVLREQADGQDDATQPAGWTVFTGRVSSEWQYEIAVEAAVRLLPPRVPEMRSSPDARPPAVPALAPVDGRPPQDGAAPPARGWVARAHWGAGLAFGAALVVVAGTGNGTTEHIAELRAGACVAGLEPEVVDRHPHLAHRLQVLPCDEPHPYEVVAVVEVDDAEGPFPGDAALQRLAADVCPEAADAHVRTPPSGTSLDVVARRPTRLTWALGADDLLCLVGSTDGPLTAPLALGLP